MKRYRQLTSVAVTLLVVSLSFSYASAAGWPPPKPKLITIATFDIGASTYAELETALPEPLLREPDPLKSGEAALRTTHVRRESLILPPPNGDPNRFGR
jgi:CHASE2 domain-containing sensor protein